MYYRADSTTGLTKISWQIEQASDLLIIINTGLKYEISDQYCTALHHKNDVSSFQVYTHSDHCRISHPQQS